MIGKEIILGLATLGWGAGMLHFAQAERIPALIQPFVRTWWLKSERTNSIICAILGFVVFISGVVFVIAGIVGWDIWPLR
ncbi:MAG: hypothetical protein JO053_13520 [Acidobacteria bacterium]|nr:hypothetical protein [Acidobacteriota bacterium]